MTRKPVKLNFIENISKRKDSYRKRQKGFLNKAHELNTLCDVELAIVSYSPYHKEPKVFPNHEAAINTFTKFEDLPELVQSKNMATQEKITKQRIEKIEKKLRKVRKENRIMELTNQMYELLNGEDMPTSMHPHDLNDLSYVINQHFKQVDDAIEAYEEGSTSDTPQPNVGQIVPGGTSFDIPRAPRLTSVGAPVSVVPPMAPSTSSNGTNFERPRATLSVPDVTSISMVPSTDVAQMPQSMFHTASSLKTPPQMVPLVDISHVPSSFSSQMFPSMISQRYPLIPHQMDLIRAPEMAQPITPTTMTYPMSSPIVAPPMSTLVFPPMAPEIDPSVNIPSVSASVPMDNHQNRSFGIPQSPSFSQLLSLSDDDIRALLDDTSFNINVQDPNHHHHNNL